MAMAASTPGSGRGSGMDKGMDTGKGMDMGNGNGADDGKGMAGAQVTASRVLRISSARLTIRSARPAGRRGLGLSG